MPWNTSAGLACSNSLEYSSLVRSLALNRAIVNKSICLFRGKNEDEVRFVSKVWSGRFWGVGDNMKKGLRMYNHLIALVLNPPLSSAGGGTMYSLTRTLELGFKAGSSAVRILMHSASGWLWKTWRIK